MSELDFGEATIVYEDPEDGYTEETVENEQIVYGRDHWAVKAGTDDQGNDLMKEIPRDRVYSVERNVERFEEEVRTVRHRVESMASELRDRLPVDIGDDRGGRGTAHREYEESEATTVPVTGAEPGHGESGEDSSRGGENLSSSGEDPSRSGEDPSRGGTDETGP